MSYFYGSSAKIVKYQNFPLAQNARINAKKEIGGWDIYPPISPIAQSYFYSTFCNKMWSTSERLTQKSHNKP